MLARTPSEEDEDSGLARGLRVAGHRGRDYPTGTVLPRHEMSSGASAVVPWLHADAPRRVLVHRRHGRRQRRPTAT